MLRIWAAPWFGESTGPPTLSHAYNINIGGPDWLPYLPTPWNSRCACRRLNAGSTEMLVAQGVNGVSIWIAKSRPVISSLDSNTAHKLVEPNCTTMTQRCMTIATFECIVGRFLRALYQSKVCTYSQTVPYAKPPRVELVAPEIWHLSAAYLPAYSLFNGK